MTARFALPISLLVLAVGCSPQSRRPVPHDRIDAVAPEGMATWRYVRDDAPNVSSAPSLRRQASKGLSGVPLTAVPWLLLRSMA